MILLLFSLMASASTFVGNGGNAGDVEWQVTLKQIQAATAAIAADPPSDQRLCSCNQTYANASTCDALKSLNEEQRTFCGATLKTLLPQLTPLVRDNRTVRVSWTTDDIDVLEGGTRRAVDAVTDRSSGTVTLNADRFRSMNPSERLFLISHELMHLTSLNGSPVVDEGAVGPFKQSRDLVNSMAAALVIEAEEAGAFNRYRRVLNRPQGWKMNWISLAIAAPSASPQSVYGVADYKGFGVRYTRFFTGLGLNAEYSERQGDRSVLSTIKAHEDISVWRVGASYRIFPFKDPLQVWGQSNLVFSADVDFVRGTYNLKDTVNDETATSSRVGGSGSVRYEFPVVLGLWLSVAETYESLPGPYTVSGVTIENEKNIFATTIGASYAF